MQGAIVHWYVIDGCTWQVAETETLNHFGRSIKGSWWAVLGAVNYKFVFLKTSHSDVFYGVEAWLSSF